MKRLLTWLALTFLLHSCGAPRTDEDTTLFSSEGVRAPVIVLDAGHGGNDTGACANGIVEKDGTLKVVLLTKKYLNSLGYRVVLTRDRDTAVPLKRRAAIANRHNASLFVSIHLNSAPSKHANGVEVFFCDQGEKQRTQSSEGLAKEILDKMIYHTGAQSRGIKMGRFHVIRETQIPSVLVELGFITNSVESNRIKELVYMDRLARGVAHGIDLFLTERTH